MKTAEELRVLNKELRSRGSMLAYAFARGMAYRRVEPVFDKYLTNHLSHWIAGLLLGMEVWTVKDAVLLAQIDAWRAVPDTPERIALREAKREAWMQRGRERRAKHAAMRSGAA